MNLKAKAVKNDHAHERFRRSNELLERAEKVIPLGAQTFSKSHTQFPTPYAPLFLTHGKGGRVWDVDGNEYVDLVCGLLSVTLGYCDPDVDAAIKEQLGNGISFSLSTELEAQLAERMVELIPCAEMVRFGKNGTDATSAAIRLARAFTGRDHVIACGYHGWQDWYIGATARNLGVPKDVQALTHKLPFNDIEAVKKLCAAHKSEIAAIILEPAAGEEPKKGYLEELREITRDQGTILIFDEVITGFRWSLGGAQSYYGVTPDLTACGKGMGNGMPISAVLGRADIMMMMEKVFYSGTFGGETLSLAASIAVIDKMKRENVIPRLWETGKKMADEVDTLINKYNLQDSISLSGADPWKVVNFKNHPQATKEAIKTRWLIEMLRAGVFIGGSHNICYAHTPEDIKHVTRAYDTALPRIADDLQSGKLEERLETPPVYPVFSVRT